MNIEDWIKQKINELRPVPTGDVAQFNYRLGAYDMAVAVLNNLSNKNNDSMSEG